MVTWKKFLFLTPIKVEQQSLYIINNKNLIQNTLLFKEKNQINCVLLQYIYQAFKQIPEKNKSPEKYLCKQIETNVITIRGTTKIILYCL